MRPLGVYQTADARQFALCFRGARAVAPPVTDSRKSEAENTHYIKTLPESTFENVLPGNGEKVDAGMLGPRMVLAHDGGVGRAVLAHGRLKRAREDLPLLADAVPRVVVGAEQQQRRAWRHLLKLRLALGKQLVVQILIKREPPAWR